MPSLVRPLEKKVKKAELKSEIKRGMNLISEEFQVVCLSLNNQKYGLNISEVIEVLRMVAITPLSEAPEFVAGVINLRGKIIPVIDLRKRFKQAPREYTLNTPIIVVKVDEKFFGLVTDNVSEVLTIHCRDIEPPTEILPETKYLLGVAKVKEELIFLIDTASLFPFDKDTFEA